jgi:hypothetical protein
MMAQFYTDRWYGIYLTRRLGTTNNSQTFTSIGQQQTMLRRRGVACHMERLSIPQIQSRVGTGRWPIMVGLDMSKVPLGIAGHPFRGSHAILLRATATVKGVPGFLVADPNFSKRTHRLDPTNGRRFYPSWVIQVAYYNAGKWALVPDKAKVIATLPDTALETEVDPVRHIPIALAKVSPGGTVYGDPNRRTVLIRSWAGQAGVGLYAKPAAGVKNPLVPIRIEVSSKLRVGYVGWDKVSNIR